MTMKALLALAALAALSTSAFAEEAPAPAENAAPQFTVIEEDARLPFSTQVIRGFQVGKDNSLIVRAGANRYYRAVLWEPCRRDLRWDDRFALGTSVGGTMDRFSTVYVDGNRCHLQSFDQIEEPSDEATY